MSRYTDFRLQNPLKSELTCKESFLFRKLVEITVTGREKGRLEDLLITSMHQGIISRSKGFGRRFFGVAQEGDLVSMTNARCFLIVE